MSSTFDSPLSDPEAFIFINEFQGHDHEGVHGYEYDHLRRCREGCTAAAGPDDYFVSKVNAYGLKPNKLRRQHEVLVATLKKTPRIGQEPDPTEHQIALQRMKRGHRHVIQPMKNADALSSEFTESWCREECMHCVISKIMIMNDTSGPCPTNDGFLTMPYLRLDNDFRHIAEICLPEPPSLPPATDYNDTVNALSELKSLVKAIRYAEEVKLAAEEERHSSISLLVPRDLLSDEVPNYYSRDFIPISSTLDNYKHRLLSVPDDATVSR